MKNKSFCLVLLVFVFSIFCCGIVFAAAPKMIKIDNFDMQVNDITYNNLVQDEWIACLPGDSIRTNYDLYNLFSESNKTNLENISAIIYLVDSNGIKYIVHEGVRFNLSSGDSTKRYATFNLPSETDDDSRLLLEIVAFEEGTKVRQKASFEVAIYLRQGLFSPGRIVASSQNAQPTITQVLEVREKAKARTQTGYIILFIAIMAFLVFISIIAIILTVRGRKIARRFRKPKKIEFESD